MRALTAPWRTPVAGHEHSSPIRSVDERQWHGVGEGPARCRGTCESAIGPRLCVEGYLGRNHATL